MAHAVHACKAVRKMRKPLSAYMFFTRETRAEVIEQFPSANFGEIARIIGQRWQNCSPEEKSKFRQMHEKDKADILIAGADTTTKANAANAMGVDICSAEGFVEVSDCKSGATEKEPAKTKAASAAKAPAAKKQKTAARADGIIKNATGNWEWQCEELGLTFQEYAEDEPGTWVGAIGGRVWRRTEGCVEVHFHMRQEEDPPAPTKQTQQQCKQIVARMDKLAEQIGLALWEDWHGRFKGPSGPWQNCMELVRDIFGDHTPAAASAMRDTITLKTIHINERHPGKSIVDFSCEAGGKELDCEHSCAACFAAGGELVGFGYSYWAGGDGLFDRV